MRSGRARIGLVLGAVGLVTALGVPPALAAGSDLDVTATVGGQSLKAAGANSPVVLKPSDSTRVEVSVTNNGAAPVEVRSIRLDGRVLGLAFFSYTTRVDLKLAAGATGKRTFDLDLGDLDGQATGLLPGRLSLLAPDRSVLASESGTVDVKGKIRSVYGVFGIAVAAITGLLLLSLLFRLVRRTLPDNRWSRALCFAVPGVGLGLVVTFTLGVLRVVSPSKGTSIGFLAGGLVVGFVLGYLTPAPGDEADRDELDERDVVAVPAVVPADLPASSVRPTLPPQPMGPPPMSDTPTLPPSLERLMVDEPTVAMPTPNVKLTKPPTPAEGDDDPRQTRAVGPPMQPPTL